MERRGVKRVAIAVLTTAALLFATAAAAQADDTGLLAQWHLDQVAGGATPDSSGNGLTGEEVNGALVPGGRFGSALATTNPNDGFTVLANPLLEPQRVTALAWVKKGAPFSVFRTIVSKGSDACGTNESYALDTGPDGGLRFLAYEGGSSYATVASAVPPATIWNNQWHAVAGTYDGATARLYVDGAQVGSAPAPIPGGAIHYGLQENRLAVGRFPQGAPCDPNGFQFVGAIDEVRLYNRALSAVEVAYLQSASATTPPSLPVPGGGGGPPPPVARFVSPTRVAPLGLAILNAGSTTGASKLKWDINGDGRTDVTCGGSSPILGLRLASAQTLKVTLTAIAPNGIGSSVTQPLTVQGHAPGKVLATDVATCSHLPDFAKGVVLSNGVSCMVDSTVTFSVVEAQGCFTHVLDRSGVPPDEAAVVDQYYNEENLPAFVQAACRKDPMGKACKDFLTEFGALDLFVSHHPVMVNGMKFTPRGGGSIVLFPALQRLVSSNARVTLGNLPVTSGAIDFDLKNPVKALGKHAPTEGQVSLFDFSPGNIGIGGFGIDGSVHVGFALNAGRRYTTATLRLALPGVFDAFAGDAPNGAVTLFADNTTNGLFVDSFHLAVAEADIGELRFRNVAFNYMRAGNATQNCTADWWDASASMFIDGGGFDLSPPPENNGIQFCSGGGAFFRGAGGTLEFGGPIPKPELFPGVFVDDLGFDVGLDPVRLRGNATISVAELSRVTGTLLVGFPSPSSPYTLSTEDASSPSNGGAVADLAPLAGRTLVSPFVALGGTAGLAVPGTDQSIDFGHGYVLYSFPDYIALGGGVRVVMPGFTVEGGLDGETSFKTRLFSLHGSVRACIAGLLCAGVEGWASNNGVVACLGDIRRGGLHPGAGYHWGDFWPTIWLIDGCRPSKYWITNVTGATDAAAARTFTVARGETAKNVRLQGTGGAPNVEVRGPQGEAVSTATHAYATSGPLAILRQDAGRVTWIGVNHGTPGRYTITPLPGSPPIAGIAGTRPGSREIKVGVTGSITRRTLHYVIGSPAGERVTFFERGAATFRRIGTARGTRGAIRFTPSRGQGGMREIVAQVQVDGVSAPERTVTRFRAPATVRTGRVRSLVVRRRDTALLVSWHAVAGAIGYGIVVKQRSASERLIRVPAGRHSVRVSGIAKVESGTVAVSARGALLDWSPPRRAPFRATQKPHTVLKPFRQLGKRPRKGHR